MEVGNIELNPDTAKDRLDTYSSLTELSGVNIFSDEFRNAKYLREKINENTDLNLKQFIFMKDLIAVNENSYSSLLFSGTEKSTIMKNYETNKEGFSFLYISVVLIAVLAMTTLYMFFFYDQKKRRKRI